MNTGYWGVLAGGEVFSHRRGSCVLLVECLQTLYPEVTESKLSVDRDRTGPPDRWYQFGFLGVQTLRTHTLA